MIYSFCLCFADVAHCDNFRDPDAEEKPPVEIASTIGSLMSVSRQLHAEMGAVLYQNLQIYMSGPAEAMAIDVIHPAYCPLVRNIAIDRIGDCEPDTLTVTQVTQHKAWVRSLCKAVSTTYSGIIALKVQGPRVVSDFQAWNSDAPWAWETVGLDWLRLWDNERTANYESRIQLFDQIFADIRTNRNRFPAFLDFVITYPTCETLDGLHESFTDEEVESWARMKKKEAARRAGKKAQAAKRNTH